MATAKQEHLDFSETKLKDAVKTFKEIQKKWRKEHLKAVKNGETNEPFAYDDTQVVMPCEDGEFTVHGSYVDCKCWMCDAFMNIWRKQKKQESDAATE